MEKEYRAFTEEQIKETCEAHEKWLASGGKEGKRADFHNADLGGARLEGVNLKAANLNGQIDTRRNNCNTEGQRMTNIEISVIVKLLSVALAIAEQYGAQEADWDIRHIWRALTHGELNDYLNGILLIDTQDAAQTIHAAPHGSKVAALIGCASKALQRSKAQPEASACEDGRCNVKKM